MGRRATTNLKFSRHLIHCYPPLFPYHSFHFSVNVRSFSSVRPAGANCICQICYSTFKLLVPFIYKCAPILPLHSAMNIRRFFHLHYPENEYLRAALLSYMLPRERSSMIWSVDVKFPKNRPVSIRMHLQMNDTIYFTTTVYHPIYILEQS